MMAAYVMRILHIGKYYAPERGGIERYTQALAEWCVAHGECVAALVHQRPGIWRGARETSAASRYGASGCFGAPLYTPMSPTFPLASRACCANSSRTSCTCTARTRRVSPRWRVRVARHLPWVVHWHADVPPDAPDWRLRAAYRVYRPFEQAVLARAGDHRDLAALPRCERRTAPWRAKTHVVAWDLRGHGASRYSIRHSGECRNPASHLFPGQPAFAGMTSSLDGGETRRACTCSRSAGSARYKGLDVLIEALAQIADATVLLVGDGECAHELKTLAAARGVAGRIAFAGNLDDATLAAA